LRVNVTTDHYRRGEASLGWELTVCNSLHPPASPCRKILKRSASYGSLLYDFLSRLVPMERIGRILEIGGGYGYLMRDFLLRNPSMQITMLDISPLLSAKQEETLRGYAVAYRVEDFLETPHSVLRGMDMAVLNENLGDFPTLLDVPADSLESSEGEADLGKTREMFRRYHFQVPESDLFHFNLGAVEAVENLCLAEIPYIFLGEHSCEASVPDALRGLVHFASAGQPERIPLKGHDEYTIKFSYLESVAKACNYSVLRGPFADFLEIAWDERLRHIMASPSLVDEEAEVLRHFVQDLYKYEYLVLMKNR
jgi:hypothetical protein